MKALSIKAGLGETYVFDVLKRNRGTLRPNLAALRKLSIALGHEPDWLSTCQIEGTNPVQVQVVAVRGKIQAGVWHEFEDFDGAGLQPVPTVPGRWYAYEQFAFQVAGDSVNKLRIFDGDFVICAHYWQARGAMTDGDIVAVERRRGPSVERTVKRLKVISETSFELWPESTNPRHQEPIRVEQNGPAHEEDGTTVEIVGLVIGRWAPF